MGKSRLTERHWFTWLLLFVAIVITAGLGAYQRMTGPTYPVSVHERIAGAKVSASLPRTHPGDGGAPIEISVADDAIHGEIIWRRYPGSRPWQRAPLQREGKLLHVELPHQPPAGKLEYSIHLIKGEEELTLPAGTGVVIRFRGDVPAYILIPHILCMFIALCVVIRAGLSLVLREEKIERLIKWVIIFLVPGGLLLGPIVQKHAFGAYWTGWPFGDDWTDNKTLAALIAWVVAWIIAGHRPRFVRPAMGVAFAVMIAVYLIPHSANGSEIDWDALDAQQAASSPGDHLAPAP